MATSTINVSFKEDLLSQIDQMVKIEFRSRSEFIREAARMYLERKQKWQTLFAYGTNKSAEINVSERDVMTEIKNIRRSQ
ncbi:hypothetical protein AGMMS49982_22700 [Bacteroidia bacterium]|nr:hypothetical protein AGMMS49982_22700 [Bacteroidia bacterium]